MPGHRDGDLAMPVGAMGRTRLRRSRGCGGLLRLVKLQRPYSHGHRGASRPGTPEGGRRGSRDSGATAKEGHDATQTQESARM